MSLFGVMKQPGVVSGPTEAVVRTVSVPWLHAGEVLVLRTPRALPDAARSMLSEHLLKIVERAKDGPASAVIEEGCSLDNALRRGDVARVEELFRRAGCTVEAEKCRRLVEHLDGAHP